jgi:winged helix DNA-binding protein
VNIGPVRLANQHVSRPTFRDPADVVRRLGAVQAQDYLGGLWAIGLRTKGATEATVEDAVARRTIVRTWPMRGTLHFVAAEDVRWILPLLTPRVVAGAQSRFRQLGLDGATFTKAARAAEKALAGGNVVRRDRLYEIWKAAGIATHEARGLHLLGVLSQQGLLCFGPRDEKQQTFTLLEEWVPAAPSLERDAALGELARRYFTSHGPATVQDFAWWAGLTVTDARTGLESAKQALESADVSDREFWFAAVAKGKSDAAFLLPPWDEFTVAYRDRSDILDPRYARRVNAGGGILSPVIVVRGSVVGTWKRTIRKDTVTVKPTCFKALNGADRALVAAAVERYARFLGLARGVLAK